MKNAKEDAISAIKFLRFRNQIPANATKSFMAHKSIAKFVNRSITYVQTICKKLIEESSLPI